MTFRNSKLNQFSIFFLAIILLFSPFIIINTISCNKTESTKSGIDKSEIEKTVNSFIGKARLEEKDPDTLFKIGNYLNNIEIDVNDYRKDLKFYQKYNFELIESENFGESISYNGFHFKKIIIEFPESEFLDDCIYLMHFIENDKKDFIDLKKEKKFLSKFLIKYPNTNLKENIENKLIAIEKEIKSGNDIID
ncbi:hypothetical protein EHQ58_18485 [Leptospira ognonensis]|uniref:Lipoprotein n=1 Tax=Leptospira ognonensis TaxID=2484945 RepID=A0A4R9JTD0_9LEPT|nr:hypothetical protein [Leptospira ognonensis]TGL55470.1 hypothetical protein EHQ58_18485 [Leptospira ognonensis]